MKRLLSFIAALTKPSSGFHVSKSGNDDNPGTLAQPWLTIQKAASTLTAGQTCYIHSGVYDESPSFANSGDAINGYITYQAYPGNTVVIGGTQALANGYVLYIYQNSYLVFKGLSITNAWSVGGGFIGGVTIWRDSHHIILDGLTCYHNKFGIILAASPTTIENITIRNCYTYDSSYYGISLNDRVTNCIIENNLLTDSVYDGLSIYHDGDIVDAPYNIQILNNHFTLNHRSGANTLGCSYLYFHGNHYDLNGATGLQIEANSHYVIIDDDLSEDNCQSIDTPAETGFWIHASDNVVLRNSISMSNAIGLAISQSSNIIIRDMIVSNNNRSSDNANLNIKGLSWYSLGAPTPTTVRMIHNIFYNNGRANSQRAHFNIGDLLPDNVMTDIVVKNNIISETAATYDAWFRIDPEEMNYNLFYNSLHDLLFMWMLTPVDWETYRQTSEHDNFSLTDDPLFVDAINNNFTLQAESPCRNAGGFLTTTTSSDTGTVVPVNDAAYFCDGYGLTTPDSVDIGSNKNCLLTAVNIAGKTISVSVPITWNSGDAVSYPYSGSSPNIGKE